MIRIIQKDNKELYQCPECGFHYVNKELAEKCEAWCREHKSCNIKITAHAEENKEFNGQYHYAMQELIRKIINALFRKPLPPPSTPTVSKPPVQPEPITPPLTQSVVENVLPPTIKWHPPIREDKFRSTQKFLNPDPLYKITGHHPGTDYGTQGEDGVLLYFCADGEVIESGLHNAFGNYFFYYVSEVDRTFVYFHLRDAAPQKGTYKAGTQCGITGKTGLSQGIHLHLECMKGRKTSADRARLYTSKDAIAEAAEDADALIRSRI